MDKSTRLAFNAYTTKLAKANGVESTTQKFSVTPTAVQSIRKKLKERSTFLGKINLVPVTHMEGANVEMGITGPSSGRTNTKGGNRRQPKRDLEIDSYGYKLNKIDTDLALPYDTMDSWAHLGNVSELFQNSLVSQIANDLEIIGWHGETAAAETDLSTNPMMQDVAPGWMQYMRTNYFQNILTEVVKDSGKIKIGAGGDFEGVDDLVADMLTGIPEWLRQDLVVLIGSELVDWERARLYKAIALEPREKKEAINALMSFGGLPREIPSNFPPRGLVITSFKNLSVYDQVSGHRRHLIDEPDYDRVMDYNSSNRGFVVEVPRKFVAVEFNNVELLYGETFE